MHHLCLRLRLLLLHHHRLLWRVHHRCLRLRLLLLHHHRLLLLLLVRSRRHWLLLLLLRLRHYRPPLRVPRSFRSLLVLDAPAAIIDPGLIFLNACLICLHLALLPAELGLPLFELIGLRRVARRLRRNATLLLRDRSLGCLQLCLFLSQGGLLGRQLLGQGAGRRQVGGHTRRVACGSGGSGGCGGHGDPDGAEPAAAGVGGFHDRILDKQLCEHLVLADFAKVRAGGGHGAPGEHLVLGACAHASYLRLEFLEAHRVHHAVDGVVALVAHPCVGDHRHQVRDVARAARRRGEEEDVDGL